MSAIEFVVRSDAGTVSRGFVGEGAANTVVASAGADISLNLTQGQIVGYKQVGADLVVTLIDGEEITVSNFFGADNLPAADLFVSSDGLLSHVDLAPGMGGTYYGNYESQDVYGKWSPDDDLYFVSGDDPALADAVVAPLAGGGGIPLWGLAGLPLLALAGLGGGGGGNDTLDDDDDNDPTGEVLEGTKDEGHVVNAEDHADGVDISGTGTPGATVDVTINGHTQTTTINNVGTWTVQFPPDQIETGTYETEIVTVITKGEESVTINDILVVDTEVRVTFNEDEVGGNGVVNGSEQTGVVTLTGSVEARSSVTVIINSVSYSATVRGTSWTLDLPEGVLPEGELTQSVTIIATDRYENSTTISGGFDIDTITSVTINSAIIGGNGTVNGAEHGAGTVITGTAQSGASVVVTVGGVAHTVVASSTGTWSTTYSSSELSSGTYTATVTAVATDGAGNTASASGTFNVDTVTAVTFDAVATGGDGWVSGAENAGTVILRGTNEPGATVSVTLNGTSHTAVVSGGTWTLSLPAGTLPAGEYAQSASVTAMDAHGNSASTSGTFNVDTFVNRLTMVKPVEGDNVINRAEAADGVTLTGTVEQGSTVNVTFNGVTRAATVGASGAWSVTYAAGEMPADGTATITINATDLRGNTRSLTESVSVDLTPPEAPVIESYTRAGEGVRGFSVAMTDQDYDIHSVSGSGTVAAVPHTTTVNTGFNEIDFNFSAPVPNGSHLVMSASDAAGNATSTLFVLEETLSNNVSLGNTGYDRFNIEAIDLQFAEDSVLTITAADLESLSAGSNALTIHGGADDTVNITGASATGSTQTIDGRVYDVYSLGSNGGMLIIDETITVNT